MAVLSLLLGSLLFAFSKGAPGDPNILQTFHVGFTPESMEYDENLNVWWISDWTNSFLYWMSVTDDDYFSEEFAYTISSAADDTGYPLSNPTGMVAMEDKLYVANIGNGRVTEFDTSDAANAVTAVAGVQIMLDGTPIAANGLCCDPDNMNMLYVTDLGYDFGSGMATGRAAVYSIDTDMTPWTVTQIYAVNTTTTDFSPNGCIVRDGVLYVVQVFFDTNPLSGWWAAFDIDGEEWTEDMETYNSAGDGIIIDRDDNWYISDWTNTEDPNVGKIWKWDGSSSDGFEVWLDMNLTSPADFGIYLEERIIGVPELNTGKVHFVEIEGSTLGPDSPDTTESDPAFLPSVHMPSLLIALFALFRLLA